jgi:hypothetical protein
MLVSLVKISVTGWGARLSESIKDILSCSELNASNGVLVGCQPSLDGLRFKRRTTLGKENRVEEYSLKKQQKNKPEEQKREPG